MSFHPNQIHLTRDAPNQKSQIPFSKHHPLKFEHGIRPLASFCSTHPALLPNMKNKPKRQETHLPIRWTSDRCIQVSIYELDNTFELGQIDQVGRHVLQRFIIERNELRIILTCSETQGHAGVWKSILGMYGEAIEKAPLSKADLQNDLAMQCPHNYDISALHDDVVIKSYRIKEDGSLEIKYEDP